MRTNTTIKLLGEHSLIECPLPKGKRVPFGVQGCLRRMEMIELVHRLAFNIPVALKEVDCIYSPKQAPRTGGIIHVAMHIIVDKQIDDVPNRQFVHGLEFKFDLLACNGPSILLARNTQGPHGRVCRNDVQEDGLAPTASGWIGGVKCQVYPPMEKVLLTGPRTSTSGSRCRYGD